MQARWIALLGCVTACSQTSSPGGAMPTGGAGGGDAMSAASGGSAGVDAADAANTEGGTDAAYTPGPAKTETLTITAGGRPRTVILHTPANLTTPTALVFNLHGSGGTAADQESYTQMDRDADRLGFIAAYGQGDIASGAGFVWNVPGVPLGDGSPVPAGAADDIDYFATAIAWLEQRYPVDPKRIYFSGFSGGGRMTSEVGCGLSDTVAAIAPVAGLRFPVTCNSARPMPVVAFHGTADGTNPFNGGGPPYWSDSVPVAEQKWGAHNGCADMPVTTPAATGVDLTAYTGCASGSDVELYVTTGADHVWPGASSIDAIHATDLMWDFFSAHPLP